ncbi:hypothetical protein E2P81_ATG05616 [Venturia nashicola]|nr:hypothetical protein E2P81_ATG05616 [Venturia nashicola]
MASRAEARMEARVRKHTEDISRSLEKICDIIDEFQLYNDNWGPGYNWDPYPGFLRLLPMRYRAGGYVLELTAMESGDHEAMNTFKFSEVSNALSKAFEQAEDITYALNDVFSGKEPSNRESDSGFDDEILKSIMNNMVGSIKAPRLGKATKDCVSLLLQKELQTIVNNKISNANKNIGVYDLPEDGRLTRSRSRQSNSTRSDSRDTITPTSSLEERDTTRDSEPWCKGCFSGCNLCLPDGSENVASKCDNSDCECREPKKSKTPKNVYADSRSSPKRHRSSKNFIRVAGKHARRQRESSAISSELNFPFLTSVKTISLDDDSDLDNITRVPGPKIYTTTTASSASSHRPEPKPSLHIADLVIEDNWDPIGHYRRREGHVIWSNGSSQAIWMDELSQKYSQELIEYYEKSLKANHPKGAPNYNYAQVFKSPIHYQLPGQYSSNPVLNPAVNPSSRGYGSNFNNTSFPVRPYSGSFDMNGTKVGNIDPSGNVYINPSTMSNNSAAAVPRHTPFAGR